MSVVIWWGLGERGGQLDCEGFLEGLDRLLDL